MLSIYVGVKEVLEMKAIDFIHHTKKDFPLMIVVNSSRTKIKEALFAKLVCSFSLQNIETIIKVIKSIDYDERSSFMMEIMQKYETLDYQGVFLWLSIMFPVSINLTTDVNITADKFSYFFDYLGVYDRKPLLKNGYPAYRQRYVKRWLDERIICIGTEKTWVITEGLLDGRTRLTLKLEPNFMEMDFKTQQIRPVSFCHWINEEIGVCQVLLPRWPLASVPDPNDQGTLHFFKISSRIPSPCNITITATGRAAELAAGCLGTYVPTEEWEEGRSVFKHEGDEEELSLCVCNDRWFVNCDVSGLTSGCAPSLCPADPRALTDTGFNRFYGWGFYGEDQDLDDFVYEKGEIVVSCSVHNHHDEEFEEELGRLVRAEEARVAAELAASRETAQDTRQKAVEFDEWLLPVDVAEGDSGEEGDGEEVRREDEETQPFL